VRFFGQLLAGFALAAVLGCGGGDLNKDLKPVDPNTPRLKKATGDGPGKAHTGPQDKPPAPVIK